MSKKIIGIACGEAHACSHRARAIAGDGRVFSWGRGTFGRLGTGKEDDELLPVPVAFPGAEESGEEEPPRFVAVAAGAYHSLALKDDGSVWSWGYNIYGQLGYGQENSSVPCLVERFLELGSAVPLTAESTREHETKPLKVTYVKGGGMMSFAIDDLGALWMWGNYPHATADGDFCFVSSPLPIPVWDFHGHIVVKVACGNEHVIAVVSAGETYSEGDLVCYAWGNNNHGQLGLGDTKSRPHPEVITAFNQETQWAIYEIACGAFHTALLTHKKTYDQEIESKCWTFGLGENGQLGHGTTTSSWLPQPVNGLPEDAILISVDCGLFHTSVVSAVGEVWSWGMEKGLGLCPDASFTGSDAGDALSPLRVYSTEPNGLTFAGPLQMACGAAHTVLVANDGFKLWAWGRGRSGVLGRGQAADSFTPTVVMWPPLEDDFVEGVQRNDGERIARDNAGHATEMDQKLSAMTEELHSLRTKLTLMERYATLLHASIFRKHLDERNLPESLRNSGVFDIRREFENLLESSNTEELARLEMFYRDMHSTVKDKLLKIRIQEIVKESLASLSARRQ